MIIASSSYLPIAEERNEEWCDTRAGYGRDREVAPPGRFLLAVLLV